MRGGERTLSAVLSTNYSAARTRAVLRQWGSSGGRRVLLGGDKARMTVLTPDDFLGWGERVNLVVGDSANGAEVHVTISGRAIGNPLQRLRSRLVLMDLRRHARCSTRSTGSL